MGLRKGRVAGPTAQLLFGIALVPRLSVLPHHLTHIVGLSTVFCQSADLFSFKVEQAVRQLLNLLKSIGMTYTGNGAQMRARKAMRVQAQLTPRFLNMGETNNGNPTPNSDRRTELAARTEAAWRRYESMR
jgi:hypothetical protein